MTKSKNGPTYNKIMRMAKEYGVDKNALFISAARQYQVQQQVIDLIKAELDEGGTAMSTKEYIKGRENVYANPLVKELPKHSDSANKTLATMLDIITKLGKKVEKESALSKFEKEYE